MRNLRRTLHEHRHFIIVVTLLTLVMTFPTIVYVFRTDVFWLPTGKNTDIFVKLWDIWYGNQILTGKADRFFTDLIYYPEGVSLAFHPLFVLHSLVVGGLNIFMPLSNAYCATVLLIIASSALSAYVYLLWLFRDKWIALFGAVVFGFGPQVMAHNGWPEIAWIAPLPLVVYGAHRGIREKRATLILLAGVTAGLTAEVTLYLYVIVLMTLGLVVSGTAGSRWRSSKFWRRCVMLVVLVGLSSAWRLIPMLQDSHGHDSAVDYYGTGERLNDIVSFVVNPPNPILGPLSAAILQTPPDAYKSKISKNSFLGFLPLTLIAFGLFHKETRRQMMPWLALGLVFVLLHLGSTLTVNGITYESIKLPKHYLNLWLPSVFAAFHRTNHFMAGICLPLAVLACFGLVSIKGRLWGAAQPRFVLAMIIIVVCEYYIPVPTTFNNPITGKPVSEESLAFLNWLKQQEEEDDIRLINLPFERTNSKAYMFYQSFTGYPQTEGGISRPPSSAYDYIRANPVTRIWREQRPTNCVTQVRDEYHDGIKQLIQDGFSHVVYHRGFYYWERQDESFRYVEPAYSDDYVSIYRLKDMLASCPS